MERRRALRVLGGTLTLVFGACEAPEERDRREITALAVLDAELNQTLQAADGLYASGRSAAAAELLEKNGQPLAERLHAQASAMRPRTQWGKAAHAAWLEVSKLRREGTERYARALRGENLEELLQTIEQQRETQKAAIVARKKSGLPTPD